MQIQKCSPQFTGKIVIPAKANTHKQYLYNEVLDIVQKDRLRADFRTNEIEIHSERKGLIDKLKELKIKFTKED